jgi:putative ABC transport system permease protein
MPGGEGFRLTAGAATRRLRQGFTVMQIAFALMLLAGAGVLLRSFLRLREVEPGIVVRGVLTMRLSLPREGYPMQRIAPFFEELTARLRQVPGVVDAGAATQFPPGNVFTSRLWLEGEAGPDANVVDVSNVSEHLFSTLGYRLVAGRGVAPTDTDSALRVAVLNQTAALRFFPGINPLGQRIRLGADQNGSGWREVVGVVADARNHGLASPVEPEVFVPVRQQDVAANNQLFLLIRTGGEPGAMLPEIRATIAALDPEQPIYAIQTLEEAFADSVATRRAAMLLLSAFAGIALALAALGVYGLLSHLVSQRTHEIGIRIALGADRRDVRRLVVRQTLLLVGTGTAFGVLGAIAVGRLLESLVFQVRPGDPLTLAAVAALLAAIGLVAAYGPARRATRVSPLEALRTET